ncbi:MAG: peptidoglycan DD-metalloendopeptidase family protein [bacterium]
MNIKNYKITKNVLILSLFIFISIFQLIPSITPKAYATTVEELQAKIDEKNKNIEALNKEIQMYADLTDKTSKEAQTLQKTIQTLTQNGKMLDTDIRKTKSQIDVANLAIQKLGINIKVSENKTSHYQDVISSELKGIQFKEDSSLIENILSKRNLSDVIIEVDSLRKMNEELGNQIDGLKTEKQVLVENKSQKEETKKQLATLQTELSGKKKVVEENKKEQSQVLKETKNQEKTYQQILAQRKAEKESLDKEVFDYEAALKYTLNPSLAPQTSSTLSLKWPLDVVKITQLFGKTNASARLYVAGTHNGVDFGAKIGTPVKAMGDGVVAGAGDTDLTCKAASFGRWILVKFNNGLAATYGHLSVISVTEGQKVAQGDIIGYSGNTGYSTGPHLHISMYDAGAVSAQTRPSVSCGGKIYRMPIAPVAAYLDPMLYLPKK